MSPRNPVSSKGPCGTSQESLWAIIFCSVKMMAKPKPGRTITLMRVRRTRLQAVGFLPISRHPVAAVDNATAFESPRHGSADAVLRMEPLTMAYALQSVHRTVAELRRSYKLNRRSKRIPALKGWRWAGPLLAQSRHAQCADECPLLGAKRTSTKCDAMSANDPKQTLARLALAPPMTQLQVPDGFFAAAPLRP